MSSVRECVPGLRGGFAVEVEWTEDDLDSDEGAVSAELSSESESEAESGSDADG